MYMILAVDPSAPIFKGHYNVVECINSHIVLGSLSAGLSVLSLKQRAARVAYFHSDQRIEIRHSSTGNLFAYRPPAPFSGWSKPKNKPWVLA